MTLAQLTYFVTAYQYKSMTKASEELHVSQPAITNAIRELEREFDLRLFSRNKTGLVPTNEGVMFFSYAQGVVEQSRRLMSVMKQRAEDVCEINLGVSTYCIYIFDEFFERFRSRYPRIKLNIFSFGAQDLVGISDTSAQDLFIIGQSEQIHLECLHLLQTHVCCLTYPESPLAQKPILHIPEDVADVPLILYKEGVGRVMSFRGISENMVVDPTAPNVLLNTNQLETINAYVRKKRASTFLLHSYAIKQEGLCCVDIDPPRTLDLCLYYRKGSLPSHVALFMDCLVKSCESITTASDD